MEKLQLERGPKRARPGQIPDNEWTKYETQIREMYSTMTVDQLASEMRRIHGFEATPRQYRACLDSWGLKKYKTMETSSEPGTVDPDEASTPFEYHGAVDKASGEVAADDEWIVQELRALSLTFSPSQPQSDQSSYEPSRDEEPSDAHQSSTSPTYGSQHQINSRYPEVNSELSHPRDHSTVLPEQNISNFDSYTAINSEEQVRQILNKREQRLEESKLFLKESKERLRIELDTLQGLKKEFTRQNAAIESLPSSVYQGVPYSRGSASIKQQNQVTGRRPSTIQAFQALLSFKRRDTTRLDIQSLPHLSTTAATPNRQLDFLSDREVASRPLRLTDGDSSNEDQPESMTHGRLRDPQHEMTDLPEEEEATRSSHRPWVASIWYWLMTMLDPPPEGAYRATYTCDCGERSYIDVQELVPGGAIELEQEIRETTGSIQYRNPNNSTSPRHNIQTPAPAHLNTSNLSHSGGQRALIQGLPTESARSQSFNVANATAQASASGNPNTAFKYLLLCVNTKHGLVKLEHIDVSIFTNDRYLFDEISNVYKTARQGHDWDLSTLVPGKGKILKWILALFRMTSLDNTKFPKWLVGPLQDCRMFVPRKIEFVKFELMPVRTEICVGNIEKPEIPGVEEVQVKKTYEYQPITIKAKILNVPIHVLLKEGPHRDLFWWSRFPKKLDSHLTYEQNLYCHGWGILIDEGWNRRLVLLLCFLAVGIFTLFVALYSVFTNDGSTGAGIGSFMMAILTLYCTLKYEQWKEQ